MSSDFGFRFNTPYMPMTWRASGRMSPGRWYNGGSAIGAKAACRYRLVQIDVGGGHQTPIERKCAP